MVFWKVLLLVVKHGFTVWQQKTNNNHWNEGTLVPSERPRNLKQIVQVRVHRFMWLTGKLSRGIYAKRHHNQGRSILSNPWNVTSVWPTDFRCSVADDNAQPHTAQAWHKNWLTHFVGNNSIIPHTIRTGRRPICISRICLAARSSAFIIRQNVRKWLTSHATDFYKQGILKLVPRYNMCLNSYGDYVKQYNLILINFFSDYLIFSIAKRYLFSKRASYLQNA